MLGKDSALWLGCWVERWVNGPLRGLLRGRTPTLRPWSPSPQAPGPPAALREGRELQDLGTSTPALEPPGGSRLGVPCARLRQLAQDNRDGATALLSCSELRGPARQPGVWVLRKE